MRIVIDAVLGVIFLFTAIGGLATLAEPGHSGVGLTAFVAALVGLIILEAAYLLAQILDRAKRVIGGLDQLQESLDALVRAAKLAEARAEDAAGYQSPIGTQADPVRPAAVKPAGKIKEDDDFLAAIAADVQETPPPLKPRRPLR